MEQSLQETLSSQRKFKTTALTTKQLYILAKKLKIPDFVGVYSADDHPYVYNHAINLNHTWIWNTDPSTEGTHWIAVKHFIKKNEHIYMLMDLFGKPVTDYPEILKTICAMTSKKSLSINSFVTHTHAVGGLYTFY